MTGAGGPAVRASDLTVRFRSVTALSRVSISVQPGEFLALAGPNGSGKTTFVRAALGLVVPSEGSVTLHGVPVGEMALDARARTVAWMPQEESVGDNVPLREYVLYGRYPHARRFTPASEQDRLVADRVLDDLGFRDRKDVGVQELSGGERQRLHLGRVLAQQTPILLLDEPTSHLDMGYQLEMLERVRRLAHTSGVAVVAALHDLNLAARYADRIVVLHRGHVVAEGPSSSVLSPALLRDVWGVVADLKRDPQSGLPYLIPRLPTVDPVASEVARGLRIHVVGGGGSAAPILRALAAEGHRVSLGAVALFDTDSEVAVELGIPTATEIPFVPLGEEVRARNRLLMAESEIVVVAPFDVGPGNLGVLDDLLALPETKSVFLVGPSALAPRDFAAGAGTVRLTNLATRSRRVEDDRELLRAIASPPAAHG
ncbi:MAG: ABC transporter ATP-binding protein [Thermoplasmata archaeon]|nr:ABC transporter ATP-binding protein [Thermoplasmata archaeon]